MLGQPSGTATLRASLQLLYRFEPNHAHPAPTPAHESPAFSGVRCAGMGCRMLWFYLRTCRSPVRVGAGAFKTARLDKAFLWGRRPCPVHRTHDCPLFVRVPDLPPEFARLCC